MRFRSLLASSLLLLVPELALAAPIPGDHNCLGRWVGTGQNTGFDSSWTIELTLTSGPSGGRCGTIEYTNPDCGGYLDACELRDGEIHTQENYTHQASDCAPPGRVIIVCNGDTMSYSWIGWERVDSVLHRSGIPPAGGAGTPMVPADPPRADDGQGGAPSTPAPSPGPPTSSADARGDSEADAPRSGLSELCPLTGALSFAALPLPWWLRRRRTTKARQ